MKFEKLRIIQAGVTTNSDVWGDDNVSYPLFITDEAVRSVVTLGNEKPIHCRRTHSGLDMLDGYLGKFVNFVYEDGVAYADLEMSEALEAAYPNEATFIAAMISKEPEMLGVSVLGMDERELNGSVIDVTKFVELYSCDIVGLPAATSSLFSNNNQNKKTMSKFFSAFAAMLKKSSFATETVETVSGSKITIEAAGEVMAIGDKVFDSEGNVHPDGEVRIKVDDAILVLVIENGVIKEVKPSEDPKDEQEDEIRDEREIGRETRSERIPEEFATRMQAMEASIAALSTSIAAMAAQFSRVSGKPAVPVVNTPSGKTKMSKEAVAEAAKRFYKK
jgi:hypothetical protein|nr:MAG TPA_asm: hypothetical protein [Caudoviricetes sp.]